MDLTEDMLAKLENTDSCDISFGEWDKVDEHAKAHERPRDWETFRTKYQSSDTIEEPMIVKIGDKLHLVSGNTRLMVARALGICPKVLLVDLTDSET